MIVIVIMIMIVMGAIVVAIVIGQEMRIDIGYPIQIEGAQIEVQRRVGGAFHGDDRHLQHEASHPVRLVNGQPQRDARAQADAEDVQALDPQMVEQRHRVVDPG